METEIGDKSVLEDSIENWHNISRCQNLSEDFIEKHADKVDWDSIFCCQHLSEPFIEKHDDKVNWYHISCYQHLSEEFIEKHADKVDWNCISIYQRLSEEFIEKHADKINWSFISSNQHLSEAFIEKYADKLDWHYISGYRNLSGDFIEKHKDKIYSFRCLEINRQTSREEKIQEMKDYATQHNLKFDGEYLYAFRDHDRWGKGRYSSNVFYEKGKYYRDWHCDMRKNAQNSFGLGIWPEGNTPVRVKVDDWGVCVNKNDGKCRVWGFEVL